jgi:hypothetical protein
MSKQVCLVMFSRRFVMQRNTIYLYPGFLTKGQRGRILWHPQKPSYNENKKDWEEIKAIDVTNCIYDPWPYTGGDRDCIMEVSKI